MILITKVTNQNIILMLISNSNNNQFLSVHDGTKFSSKLIEDD